ncbi:MAG: 3-phosphoserine/phosphohydroxythreonine transaminase [Gammaproteobacteria bacterium]|nr:3-phosphoserine/phosphohydroxythreonine transaminase [Gammaproteobacteria bacterium]
MRTVYNFASGPAMLPRAVMEQAQAEFLDWRGTGMSVMEISHRGREFQSIVDQSIADLRALLGVGPDYDVLFVQGGATGQFSMVPLNLCPGGEPAAYVHTGHWSGKAMENGARHCEVRVAASSAATNFSTIPPRESWQVDPGAAYLFYTANETIGGVEFHDMPAGSGPPLVSDMTSNFLSRPVDVSRFGIIFAGAQKNFGPAGLVVVIIRKDLIGRARSTVPLLYDYASYSGHNSLLNTPATFSWYVAALSFAWIRRQGGVEVMEENARRRSGRLYRAIDAGDFYSNSVPAQFRSRMNVPFTLKDPALDKEFLQEARAAGLEALAGHRTVGGMRASLYNGMPDAGVDALVDFMGDFARRRG